MGDSSFSLMLKCLPLCFLLVIATRNEAGSSGSKSKPTFVTCERSYKKIGCYKEGFTNFLLINDRDPTHQSYEGSLIQWTNVGKSLHSLMCRCVKKARRLQYRYVGIRFYAECFGVRDGDISNHVEENGCFQYEQNKQRECEIHDSDECAGSTSEYIYEILPENQDGGYSPWAQWTKCSVPCGNGVKMRNRFCNNPINLGTGKNCSSLGSSTQFIGCSMGKCP
eukprot:Seg656.1 transcript_id=Seg656.1/GoldUCD/mRNA.D3Y31 product=Coadhesin protein_id=Seg656.1/GoldUCD/D3Y31